MHLISELSDRLEASAKTGCEEKMISKKDIANLESILLLRAVEQHAGKRKASEALNTSVDTINKYLDNLEQELGVKLLSTSSRGSNLTNVARRIADKAGKVKEILDDIYSIRHENKEVKGEVRVFLSMGFASYLVPHDLSVLFDLYPELSVNSVTTLDFPKLHEADYDIAITYANIDEQNLSLITEKKIKCGFFASPQYLARNGYPINMDDMLKNYRVVLGTNKNLLCCSGHDLSKEAKNICFISNNVFTLINVVENGTGIGIMPLSFTKSGLVCLDNIPCDCVLNCRLFANKNTKNIPRVRTMINFYKDVITRLENPIADI